MEPPAGTARRAVTSIEHLADHGGCRRARGDVGTLRRHVWGHLPDWIALPDLAMATCMKTTSPAIGCVLPRVSTRSWRPPPTGLAWLGRKCVNRAIKRVFVGTPRYMEGVPASPGLLRRGWSRILDGGCAWGSISVCPDRMGVTRYLLVVYPPGINATERRRLRVWRGWPAWGALLWLASYSILSGLIGPRTALTMSAAAYIGTGVVAFMRAGVVRTRVHTMSAMVMSGYHDARSRDACHKLQALAARLIEADQHRGLGLISPIEYEMTWWQVYDRIELDHSGPHRTHWWEQSA